jgi:hypothetical protein
MEIPKGFECEGSRDTHVLQLIKNLYGQKQAGRVWNQHLVKQLSQLGFRQSQVDECVFYYRHSIFLMYMDDTILMGPDEAELDVVVSLLKSAFQVEVEGNLCDYLGINIKRQGRTYDLTQPQLNQSSLI